MLEHMAECAFLVKDRIILHCIYYCYITCVCVCSSLCVCVGGGACVHVCRPEANDKCLLQLFSTLHFLRYGLLYLELSDWLD